MGGGGEQGGRGRCADERIGSRVVDGPGSDTIGATEFSKSGMADAAATGLNPVGGQKFLWVRDFFWGRGGGGVVAGEKDRQA